MATDPVTEEDGFHTVWQATLDDRYLVKVIGEDANWYSGVLIIEDNGTELLREPTNIIFGAPFGPDVDDVARWQDRATEFIDERPA